MRKKIFQTFLWLVILSALFAPSATAESLEELAQNKREVSELDWRLLQWDVRLTHLFNYPSKPTFMGVFYDKKNQKIEISFEIRESFLEHYSSRSSVIESMEQSARMVELTIGTSLSQHLLMRFHQQGGGDGKSIATFENRKLTILQPKYLTPGGKAKK